MDEIFKILFQIGLILFIFLIPIFKLNSNNTLSLKNATTLDQTFFNFIILINLILFLSFFSFKISSIIFIISFFILASLIYNLVLKYNFLGSLEYKLKLFFFTIFFILISFDLLFNLELGWDAQKLWFPKVLNFYQGNTIANLETLLWPEYPFLGSLLWAFFWKISFSEYEYLGRLIYVFIFCLSIFSISEILKLSFIKQMLFTSLSILLIYNYNLFNGYQEIIIFSLVILAAKYSYLIILEKRLDIFYLIFLLLIFNSIIWIKNEGIFISLFLFFNIFLFSKYKLKHKLISLFILILLIALRLLIFKFYNFEISLQPGSYNNFSLSEIFNKISIDRLSIIYKYLIQSIFKNYLVLLSLLFILFYFIKKKNFKNINFVLFYFFLNIVFINFAYLLTDLPIEFAAKSGTHRLMFEFSGYYLLFIIIFLNEFCKQNKKN